MGDRLPSLWDFDDLDGTEERLLAQLDAESSDEGRAEVIAQLARVAGLRGDFDRGNALLDDATALGRESRAVATRVDLERGRLRRSSGDSSGARPLFESAYAVAVEEQQHYLAADAAHMVALVAGGREDFGTWTQRGIALAERFDEASYWLGPLLNNLGWERYEHAEYEAALDAFERALQARQREPANAAAIEIARYAVGKTLRALDRPEAAIPLVEQAVAWAEAANAQEGWFHEELAEEYAAVGRLEDAREQARRAIPLLERDDPSFAGGERATRLRALADAESAQAESTSRRSTSDERTANASSTGPGEPRSTPADRRTSSG